ncbi:MAG: hypothetical protein ACK5OC_16830 [Pirellula sp.]
MNHGVKIRFDHTGDHNLGSLWFLSYDGRESYGIRVGHGLQVDDNTGKPVVVLGAPGGWENPQPPVLLNNRNHLGEKSK